MSENNEQVEATVEQAAPVQVEAATEQAEATETPYVKKNPDFDEFDEVFSYNVEVGGETRNFPERLDAVAYAKDETIGNERTAFLTRSDERMRMQFRDGGLTDYVLETRKGRKV